MRWLVLTLPDGGVIVVNQARIETMQPHGNSSRTVICFSLDEEIYVTESLAEIAAQMESDEPLATRLAVAEQGERE
jgi:hypothetical protein